MVGLKIVVKVVWNGMMSFVVVSGSVSVKFLGMSLLRIIDSIVVMNIVMIVVMGVIVVLGMFQVMRVGWRRFDSVGFIVYLVSSVVSVMLSWVVERCVEVCLRVLIVSERCDLL